MSIQEETTTSLPCTSLCKCNRANTICTGLIEIQNKVQMLVDMYTHAGHMDHYRVYRCWWRVEDVT